MKKFNLTYKKIGEIAILIEWPSKIDPEIIQDITSFESLVVKDQKVVDTIIAYNSLTVRYSYLKHFEKVVEKLKIRYETDHSQKVKRQKIWQIPVCYDLQFGWDLEEIAREKKLSVDEVIQLHTQPNYLIYFLGFQPGFLYLGGLDEKLHTPRRANPRLRVEKGAVGIGGEQTGVYPQHSAGGWNIIGKSPVNFFDISKPSPCFARAGDFICFEPIDLHTFEGISDGIEKGTYQLKYHWL